MALKNIKRKSQGFWRRYIRNRVAVVSLVIILLIIFVAIFAPWIAPWNPSIFHEESFARPSSKHFFGTDDLGRDIFSCVIHGSRTYTQPLYD